MTILDDTIHERDVAVGYLDAIRLANEGTANDISFRRVVTSILEDAPVGLETDTLPTRYLVDAIQATQAEITVA